jgi:hypothetical protein
MSSSKRARDLLGQISQERAAAAGFRTKSGLAILAMFLLFAGVIYNKINNFDTEALVVELQRSATRTVWPLVYKELDKVGKEALPALSKAVSDEVAKIGPVLSTRLDGEAKIFQLNMAKKMRTSLDGALAGEFAANKDKLKGQLKPFAADDAAYDDMVRKMRKAGQDWAHAKLDSTFSKHIRLLQSINETVQRLGVQAKKGGATADSMDDVMLIVAEILNARVNEDG